MNPLDLDKSSIEYKEAELKSACYGNREEEANVVTPPWSELPPHIIEKIYSFLDRHNQSNMSVVCRRWANEYASPSLWRNVKFYLRKFDYNVEISPEVRLTRKYGAMFHHVEIICEKYDDLDFVGMQQLYLFLKTLMHNSQLLSITFRNMDTLFKHLEDDYVDMIMFDTLFVVIKNLILSQNKLQSLHFENPKFKTSKAVDLLRIICTKNTLKDLFLPEFVKASTRDEVLENTFLDCSDLENLMNLREWTINYSQIFENIVTNFYEYANQSHMTEKKWKLQILYLFCDAKHRVNYLGISSSVWKYIRKVCPQLKIHLIFKVAFDIRNELDLFITPNMPIISVDFQCLRISASNSEICTALRHFVLCGINKNLKLLALNWFFRNTNLTSDLKNFLKVSPKLRMLVLCMNHRIEGLHTLFKDWLENRPISLENVLITTGNYMDDGDTIDDLKNFLDLKDKFVPALKKLGLNLILEVF